MNPAWFNRVAGDANDTAKAKGFWDPGVASTPLATKLALVHTEIAEATEALLDASNPKQKELIAGELADVVIRIADLSVAQDIPISQGFTSSDRVTTGGRLEHGMLILHDRVAKATEAGRREDFRTLSHHLAQAVLTCESMCISLGRPLDVAVEAKLEINRGRPTRHGRAF